MDKVLSFDCYGTLLDTNILYNYIYDLAEKNGRSGSKAKEIFINYEDRLMYGEDYIPYDRLLLSVLEYCDMELRTGVFAAEWENIINIHKEFEPYEDVVGALEYLKKQNYEIVFMSNTTHELINAHLKKLGKFADAYVVAEDVKCYKPNLKFFKYTGEKHHFSDKEHTHIAKGYWWDIVPCAKLGWNKIWVNRNHITGSKKHLPYQEISSLEDLKILFPL